MEDRDIILYLESIQDGIVTYATLDGYYKAEKEIDDYDYNETREVVILKKYKFPKQYSLKELRDRKFDIYEDL